MPAASLEREALTQDESLSHPHEDQTPDPADDPSTDPASDGARDGGLSPREELFRSEALAHHLSAERDHGRALELSPHWTPWVFRLLLVIFACALIFALVARLDEYATGTFFLRMDGRDDVTASQAGTITGLEVRAGESVVAGQILVRLYSAQEAAELRRIRREYELALVQRLRNPSDPSSERNLGALRAQKEWAEARLEERVLRAPIDGVISDMHVQPGQPVAPGESVVSVSGSRSDMSVVALLPGHFRPLIEAGMPLRLELEGYRYAYQYLTIEGVSEEVFGSLEARRFLGATASDALRAEGPVIFVYARLDSPTFSSAGHTYSFHEGMRGTAEVRVRSEGLLAALFPGIRSLWTRP